MSRAIAFPDSVKSELRRIAAAGGFVRAREILDRGNADELILESAEEAQIVRARRDDEESLRSGKTGIRFSSTGLWKRL